MPSRPRLKFRKLNGILLLDKPQGMSSNAALQVAKRLFQAEKAGHTGSLDPLATGLLPLCFGEATKIAGLLLGSAKAYDAEIALGTVTDTDDAEGAVLRQREVPALDREGLVAALQSFQGRIQQRAPVYSALKQGGEPLYAKARRGEVIEAPVREVEVHRIEILEQGPERLKLRVECGSGTYIRSIARDLGEVLGCGAHISALRRLWVEPFRPPAMLTLESLQELAEAGGQAALDARLLPLEAGLAGFPAIHLDVEEGKRFQMGQRLSGQGGVDTGGNGTVAVHGPSGRALGLGDVTDDGILSPRRLFLVPAD